MRPFLALGCWVGCSLFVGLTLVACMSEPGGSRRRMGGGDPDAGFGPGTDGGRGDRPPGCADREICGNGVDDDCSGDVDETCGCVPGQTQRCYLGPRDLAGVGACRLGMQTCDDVDGEFSSWGECTGETGPAVEACDGREDEDCDGMVDEGCGCPVGETRDCYTGPAASLGVGPCHGGTQTCQSLGGSTEWSACTGEVTPGADRCDGVDLDCDGRADTGCDCTLGDTRACYTGPPGTSGVGICRDGIETCIPADPGATWGPCEGERLPEADRCDGIDYTCTGLPGVGCACVLGESRACYGGPPSTRGVGLCRDGTNTCVSSGGGPEWSASCAGERQPSMEVCANGTDEDCDGAVDEGCGGTIMCPGGARTVPAGQPVELSVTGMGLVSYSWRVVTGPTGGAATAEWAPSPPTAATESFTPFIVGDYEIEMSGMDASGATVTCRFRVTALPHGLRVQLRWDGAGDVDLHVHQTGTTTPWFMSPDDCYYANTSPAWGASLDIDNTSADGPENVSMDSPVTGATYTVAVHNYARAAGRRATIDVFCGATMSTVPTATFTSRALAGTAAGNCSANDFWTVASVRFTSPSTCVVTALDTYRPSSTACTAF